MDMVDAVLTQQLAPQNTQTPDQSSAQSPQQPDGVDAVLEAAAKLPNLDSDPAYQSMQLHTAAMQANGRKVSDTEKQAILQAYKSLYGQRPMEAAGGNSAYQEALQQQAAGNSAVGNFARAGANAFAQTGANIAGIVAPDAANRWAAQAQAEYNPDLTTASGKAGALTGNVVSTLPAVLVPGAAVPGFAALGFGEANREVSQQNANGANIGMGQRLAYDATTAAIQGLVAHFLGKMAGGGLNQTEGGAVTQTLPLQNLLRRLSPDLLESMQGTDGAVLRPIVQRTLLNMGIGAGQNEVAMIAQEIARSAEGIAQPGEKDLVDRILTQTPETLLSGAAQALPFALHGELTQRGLTTGEVEHVPQENIQELGKAGGTAPRAVRYASEENPFEETETKPQTPAAPAEGTQLPADERLSQNPAFMQSLADQQQQLRDSNDVLNRVNNGGSTEGNGKLPNDFYGQPAETHPLVTMLQGLDPSVRQAEDIPAAYQADFKALADQGIKPVAVTGDNVPAGFSSADHPDAVAIDVSNPEKAKASIQNVVAHEAAHVWQDLNPEKVDRLYRLIPAETRQKYQDWYFNALAKQRGTDYAQEYMAKNKKAETISMAFGDAASQSGLVQRAFQKDQSLWGTIKDAFTKTLNNFTGKGRMLNAIADEMRSGLGLPKGENPPAVQTGEGQQAPKNYYEIGHGRNDNEELWWKDENGEIQTSENRVHAGTPGFDEESVQARGRIDHTAKQISVMPHEDMEDTMARRRVLATAKELQDQYPKYKVFVTDKGGLTPLEDAQTNGRFMLQKLDNIANNEDDVKKYKAALNANSPANAIQFETTAEDKVKRAVFDNQAPLVSMIRTAMSRINDPAKLSPEAYLRRMAGFRERRYQQEKAGLRSLTGEEILDKTTGKNLTRDWLIEPLKTAMQKTGEKIEDIKGFAQSVMVAQRTLEKANKIVGSGGKLDEAISGIGQHRTSGLAGEKDVDEATDYLKQAKQEPQFQDALEYARRLRQWGNEHLKMAVESGLVSKQSAADMLRDNKFYVNMQRVMEDHGVLGEGDFADGKYHRFRGSNRMIDDPLANTLQTTEQIAKKADENFTKQKIIDLVKPFGDMAQKAKKAGPDTIQLKYDGNDSFYHVDPQVANVVNSWGKNTPSALWGALSMPGRLKMLGTLLRPMFRWNHFRKQFQNRILLSDESGGLPGIAKTVQGFDPDTKELLDVLGGTMSHDRDYGTTASDYHQLVSKMLDKVGGDKNSLLALPKKVWNGYQTLGEWSDAFNRIVEFKSALANAKRRGMNDLDAQTYAAWKARDLMDFSVGGEVVKQINRIAYQPFMNAEIQGLRKMYEMARTNPTQAASRLAMFGLLPSMIPYLWAKSQGKDAEANYKDTPLAQRIMFYQFPIGNFRMMIPKGQTQAMASALWEAFLDKHNGDIGTWAKAMGDSGLIPRQIINPESLLPFQGVREAISNYSWFYDRHIIPPDQEGLALDLRHTNGASGLAQQISSIGKKAGWELDPRKIDHVLANDFGTVGMDVESASNIGRKDKPLGNTAMASYADVRLPPGYTSVSVQDAMTAAQRYNDTSSPQYKAVQEALGTSYSAKTVQDRNDLVNQARAAADTANAFYQKHGDELLQAKIATQKIDQEVQEGDAVQGGAARRQWAASNPDKLALLKERGRLEILQKRISEIRKAMANPNVSASTKAAGDKDLTRLYGVIVQLAADAGKSMTQE